MLTKELRYERHTSLMTESYQIERRFRNESTHRKRIYSTMKFTLVVVYCATPLNRNKKGKRTSKTYSTSATVDEYKQNPISADDRVDFSMSNNAKLFPFFPLYSGWLWYINRLAQTHSQCCHLSQELSHPNNQKKKLNCILLRSRMISLRPSRDSPSSMHSHWRRQDMILVPLTKSLLLLFSFVLLFYFHFSSFLFVRIY